MYRAKEKQMSIYDYLPPYHGELRDKNRWVRLAVLWRVNPSWKQNLFMTGLLWAVGAAAGMVLQLIF